MDPVLEMSIFTRVSLDRIMIIRKLPKSDKPNIWWAKSEDEVIERCLGAIRRDKNAKVAYYIPREHGNIVKASFEIYKVRLKNGSAGENESNIKTKEKLGEFKDLESLLAKYGWKLEKANVDNAPKYFE